VNITFQALKIVACVSCVERRVDGDVDFLARSSIAVVLRLAQSNADGCDDGSECSGELMEASADDLLENCGYDVGFS